MLWCQQAKPLERPVRNPFDVSEPGLQVLQAGCLYCWNFPIRRAGTLISTLNAPTHESKHSSVGHLRFASPVNNYISCSYHRWPALMGIFGSLLCLVVFSYWLCLVYWLLTAFVMFKFRPLCYPKQNFFFFFFFLFFVIILWECILLKKTDILRHRWQ